MRRALWATLAALLVALPASAQLRTSQGYYVSSKPYNRRVAVVIDDYGLQSQSVTNYNIAMQAANTGIRNLYDVLRAQGADVAFYTYSWMENDQSGGTAPRWANLGDYYPVVFCPNWAAGFQGPSYSNRMRYFKADSTNAVIIHSSGYKPTMEDVLVTGPDSLVGTCDSSFSTGVVTYTRAPQIVGTSDTLTGLAAPTVLRIGTLPPDVKEVVRLANIGAQTDSLSTTAGDSLVWGYKVRYSSQGHADVAEPVAWFVPQPVSVSLAQNAHVIYAIISRYVKLDPIKVALNWDDVGNWACVPTYGDARPASFPANWGAPRPGLMDSIHTEWVNTWGAHPTFSGQADTLVAYYNGTASGLPSYPFLKLEPTVVHVHDVDSTNIYSNPFGHGSNNGGNPTDTLHTSSGPYSRRVAFRRDPTNSSVMLRYGIYNRIVTSDSLLSANGFRTSPYMDFANDSYVPPNFGVVTSGQEMTADSLFQAIGEAGKLWIRGYIAGQLSSTELAINTTDPTRYFAYPDERFYYRSPTTGAPVSVRCVGSIAISSSATVVTSDADMWQYQQRNLCKIMGLQTSPVRTLVPAFNYGEAAAPSQDTRTIGLAFIREVYEHPRYFTNVPNGYEVDVTHMRRAVFQGIAGLNAIAGHDLIRWVYPWQVYGH